jgi:hypothetical protein
MASSSNHERICSQPLSVSKDAGGLTRGLNVLNAIQTPLTHSPSAISSMMNNARSCCNIIRSPAQRHSAYVNNFPSRGMSPKNRDGGFWNAEVARQQFYNREICLTIARRLANCGAKFTLANFFERY